MTISQIKKNNDLSSLFIFDDSEAEEQQAYMEEIGTLIFQSALMKYLADKNNEEAKIFETFVNLNVGNENFVALLCKEYPEFGQSLNEEVSAFKSEIIF